MPWDQLGIYIYNLGHQVMPVRGDGFCFLDAIDLVLYCYHNEVVTLNSLASNILGHLAANVNFYKEFHTEDVLKDTEGYFKFGNYCDSVLNVIIFATARALKLNLSIYQKGPNGNIQILKQTTNTTGREVHLKFTQNSHNPANNHYDAILLFDKHAEICQQDEDNFEMPSPTSLQQIMQDDADEVIDLTDDSKTTVIQHPEFVPYNNNNNELQFTTNLFDEHSTRIGWRPYTGYRWYEDLQEVNVA